MRFVKTGALNALLCGTAIGVVLLLFEAYLRLFQPVTAAPHFYRPHPQLGYELVPGAAGYRAGENPTPVHFQVGADSFRKTYPATAAEPLVVFLGDSFTEAAQVEAGQTFVSRVGDGLARAGAGVRLVNAGVSGYGTSHQLLTYRAKLSPLAPELVVLAFCSGNDITDNAEVFRPDGEVYYALDGDTLTGPITPGKHPNPIKEWLRFNSRIYPWLAEQKTRLRHLAQGRGDPADHGAVFYGDDWRWREAWTITARLIAQLNDAVRADGGRLAIAVLPVGYQVYHDPRHHHQPGEDLYRVEARLTDIAAANGIPLLPMLDTFQAAAGKNTAPMLFFDRIGHFTPAGHRLAAQLLAPFVAELLTVDGGRLQANGSSSLSLNVASP